MGSKLAGDMTSKLATAAAAAKASTRAYVTFLEEDSDESWKRVVELAKGLNKVGSPYPLVVVVLPDVPESHRRILISEGCVVREVEPVYPPPENQTQQLAMADVSYGYDAMITYSKLRIWELVEFERVVYLDADVIQQQRVALENIDDLFELEKGHLYAVIMNSGNKTYYVEPPVLSDDKELVPPSSALNYYSKAANMFVCEPSMTTAKALLKELNVCPRTAAADLQDFLHMFFRDQYKPILLKNTLVSTMGHPDHQSVHKCLWWTDQKMAEFSNYWLTTAKETLFARDNLPALATVAASCAAVGVIATANPVICFGFYAVFITVIAVATTSLRTI